ncbi:hypothetical protein BH11GEM2_BH11GEM2_30820 [soil metagenome]
MVLNKVRTDGLKPTVETMFNKLDQPLPLRYCNVGAVLDVGGAVRGFAVGDRVVSNGHHAEVLSVPKNLCARIPHAVSDDEAGRCDATYEEKGVDHPVVFVRWTEQRNFEAILGMMADGRLDVKPLVSHRFPIADARQANELVGGSAPSLGILLQYPTVDEQPDEQLRQNTISFRNASARTGKGSAKYSRASISDAMAAEVLSLSDHG